jgi:hypothetical protein
MQFLNLLGIDGAGVLPLPQCLQTRLPAHRGGTGRNGPLFALFFFLNIKG